MTRVLVTGAGGYVGGAIAALLVRKGFAVRSYSRGEYESLARIGVEQVRGDLRDEAALKLACRDCDGVFHVAARVGMWGPLKEFEEINVRGTGNVIAACRAARVGRLVFTSSPSVVFNGGDVEGWNEKAPFPINFDCYYSRTKAEAERLVRAANAPGLMTVAIRPHLVWGPGHNHIVSRIVEQGRRGKLARIGGFNKLVDTTYIDDAAAAHLLAFEKLVPGSPVCGKAYFISQGEPWPVWDMTDGILAAAGLPSVKKRVPYGLAMSAASAGELVWRALRRRDEPRLTRFVVKQLCTAHWFDITAARRDLGFTPSVSVGRGLESLKEWFKATL